VIESPAVSARQHERYVLFLLFLVYTFNYVDRQVLIILAEPIKSEFKLKDWQLGFLTGTAFALFYATLGIPIARFADRLNRVNIIAASLTIWSSMTAACAVTTNFAQLALARVGVGVGEAGGSPPAVSLLASYFDRSQRSTAMSIYSLGATVGILLGFVIGGLINVRFGWRAAFLAAGLPGIVLAALVKWTIREPRAEPGGNAIESTSAEPIGKTLRTLYSIETCRLLNAAAVAAGITVYGFMVWTPVLLIRRFGLTTGEVGTAIGLIAGIAGSAGVFLGGLSADHFAKADQRRQLWVPAATSLLFWPLILVAVNAATARTAFICLVPAYGVALAYTGPTWAVLQSVTPPQMRAMAAAILLFLVNLIGLGMGPQLIGIISDVLRSGAATTGLRHAIEIVCSASMLASLFFYLASRSLASDLAPDTR
jgi:predicted MFS family arabinose efflux permease